MRTGLQRLNALSAAEAEAALLLCCGSRAWARAMAAARPFTTRTQLLEQADSTWSSLAPGDWLEAFAAHPRIGERAGEHADARAAHWSEDEQRTARESASDVLAGIAAGNRAYEERFGHLFLICAQGLTGSQILRALHTRLRNDPGEELRVAGEEQRRITHLRLDRMIGS